MLPQRTTAEHKVMWMKYQDLQDEFKAHKIALHNGEELLRNKRRELEAAQAPLRRVQHTS